MRVNGAHNTVGKILAPTTLFGLCCATEVAEYYFLQVYRVRSLVSWFDLCALPYFSPFVPWSFPGGRPRSIGPSRLWLC